MNIRKVKKCHINMEQFINENQFGINKLEELAERAAEIWNEVKCEIRPGEPLLNDRLIKHGLPEYLSARSISLLENCKNGVYLFNISKCPKCNRYTKINIFGYLKIGQRSSGELADDVLNLYVYDEKHDTRYLDLDRAIQIGLKFKPLINSTEMINNSMNIVFDVDATLIRALNSGTALGNEEDVDKAILRTMMDRIIVMMVSRLQLSSIIDNYLKLDCGNEEVDRKYDLKEILKIAFIYKIWYNAINGIQDIDVEKSVENVLDLVNLASKSFNATQAIPDVYNTIHSKIMTNRLDVDRYPDRMVEKCINFYRNAMNYYSFRDDNGRRSHAQYIKNKTIIGVESLSFESMLQTIGVTQGFRDKKRASMSLVGIESIQQSTREFDEFKRKSRGAIMAKLEYKERITYVKYESDVMKFRAEAIGCKTEFTKGSILKRGETIGKLIQMELSRPHSEEFVTLMCMLDSERITVQAELANRDIFKEKNTMLNGTIATKNEWNY